MSYKCKAFSQWRAESGNTMPMQRDAFNAGWCAAIERAIELLADEHGIAAKEYFGASTLRPDPRHGDQDQDAVGHGDDGQSKQAQRD